LSAQGILGNGTTTNLPQQVPVAVAGGLTFTTISVGELHACGVTPDGAAYCWGFNRTGNLGDGTTTTAMTPVAVKGGLAFASISAGTAVHIDETNENPIGTRTCGVTIGGVGYCWGDGLSGSLGNGASFPSWTPAALAGGLTFRSITVGNGHACGVTTSDVAYCWGDNSHGQFGNGTLIYSPTPVRVGAMP
jgi:alpha-tubulin suppressor-like RCC1 family protein